MINNDEWLAFSKSESNLIKFNKIERNACIVVWLRPDTIHYIIYSLIKLFISEHILCVALLLLLHSTLKYNVFFGFSDYVYRLLGYEYIITTCTYVCRFRC